MNVSKTHFGMKYLPLTNSQEEFRDIILNEIEQSEHHFIFNDLIARIRSRCSFKEESHENYAGGIDFSGTELDFINTLIWEQIWDKKLMIDFTDKRPNHNSDTFFLKNNHLS